MLFFFTAKILLYLPQRPTAPPPPPPPQPKRASYGPESSGINRV